MIRKDIILQMYAEKGVIKALLQISSFILLDLLGTGIRLIEYRIRYFNSFAKPYKIIYIDPSGVEYAVQPQLTQDYSNYGYHILDGDWDTLKHPDDTSRGIIHFSDYEFYQSMCSHFQKEISWDETNFFKKALKDPKRYRGESPSEVKINLDKIQDLFEDIQREGYKSQRELKKADLMDSNPIVPEHNEIKVDISRDGAILFEDGRHRISISKILNLDEVPVRIVARHKQWQMKRKRIARYESRDEVLKDFNMRILQHPDMQDVLPDSDRD